MRWRRARPGRECLDRGSGTVLALGLAGVVTALLLVVLLLGSAVAARHRAAVSADLAALAAADVVLGRASGDPCDRAVEVALVQGSRVEVCTVVDGAVTVTVSSTPHGAAAALGTATARARAGAGPSPED